MLPLEWFELYIIKYSRNSSGSGLSPAAALEAGILLYLMYLFYKTADHSVRLFSLLTPALRLLQGARSGSGTGAGLAAGAAGAGTAGAGLAAKERSRTDRTATDRDGAGKHHGGLLHRGDKDSTTRRESDGRTGILHKGDARPATQGATTSFSCR